MKNAVKSQGKRKKLKQVFKKRRNQSPVYSGLCRNTTHKIMELKKHQNSLKSINNIKKHLKK